MRAQADDEGLSPREVSFAGALKSAAKSPGTWVPLALAVPFLFDNNDRRFSNRMREREDVFGGDAREKSDDLRGLLKYSVWLAALAPRDCVSSYFCGAKWERLGFTALSLFAQTQLTHTLKNTLTRDRPFAADLAEEGGGGFTPDSMPSAHATDAFFGAALSSRHIGDASWSTAFKRGVQASLWAGATAVAVARIEGGMHYPTDVLVGAAVGNFVAGFFYEVYLARHPRDEGRLQVGVTPERISLKYEF